MKDYLILFYSYYRGSLVGTSKWSYYGVCSNDVFVHELMNRVKLYDGCIVIDRVKQRCVASYTKMLPKHLEAFLVYPTPKLREWIGSEESLPLDDVRRSVLMAVREVLL
jgi:hypothetical protein